MKARKQIRTCRSPQRLRCTNIKFSVACAPEKKRNLLTATPVVHAAIPAQLPVPVVEVVEVLVLVTVGDAVVVVVVGVGAGAGDVGQVLPRTVAIHEAAA